MPMLGIGRTMINNNSSINERGKGKNNGHALQTTYVRQPMCII